MGAFRHDVDQRNLYRHIGPMDLKKRRESANNVLSSSVFLELLKSPKTYFMVKFTIISTLPEGEDTILACGGEGSLY